MNIYKYVYETLKWLGYIVLTMIVINIEIIGMVNTNSLGLGGVNCTELSTRA